MPCLLFYLFPLQFNLPSMVIIDWSYIVPEELCILTERNLIILLIAAILLVLVTKELLVKLCISRPFTRMESTTTTMGPPKNPDTRPSNNSAKDAAADAPLPPSKAVNPEAIHPPPSKRGHRGSESDSSDTTDVREPASKFVESHASISHSTTYEEEDIDLTKEELPDRFERLDKLLKNTVKCLGGELPKRREIDLEF
ncbi:hypothetical protein TWF281_011909 [Arthrobotrys megalospora]